jgi:hypothetical protein
MGGIDREYHGLRPALEQNLRLYLKKAKRAQDMDQVVESFPSKCQALSSNPITTNKNK